MRLGFDRPTGTLLALGQPLFGHECDAICSKFVVVSLSPCAIAFLALEGPTTGRRPIV